MVSCTVCRKEKGRAKVEVSTVSATTVESQVIRPSSVMQKVEKQKERGRMETAKVGTRGCRFRSWRNSHASGLVDKPSFDRVRWVESK